VTGPVRPVAFIKFNEHNPRNPNRFQLGDDIFAELQIGFDFENHLDQR